jgi:amino-acid N-acetyltransferase
MAHATYAFAPELNLDAARARRAASAEPIARPRVMIEELPPILVRKARPEEVVAISGLNNQFADEALMLRRTPEMIALAVDDYVVAVDRRGAILACGALKEYSPSVAEVAAIAVAKEAHGKGLGRAIVRAVEALAVKRGIWDVFALTLQPEFFGAIGYARVDRARYPEKIRRDCLACARRFACNEICYARNLLATEERTSIAPARAEPRAGRVLPIAGETAA